MARLLVPADRLRDPDSDPQFKLDGWIDTAPFEDLLGMTIEEAGEGVARLSMPFRVAHAQGGGVMHGGALTALADTAVAIAIKTIVPDGTRFATTELQVEFINPVVTGVVIAEARVEGPVERELLGRVEMKVAEQLVARVSCQFRIARNQVRRDGPESL